MKRRTVLTAALGIAALGSGWWGTGGWGTGGRNARTPLQEFATGGIVFGTTVSLRVLHDDEARARAALAAAMAALHDIDRLMSLYRPDSALSRLNRDGQLDRPDPRLLAVLQAAQSTAALTDGAFDVTVQPLWAARSSGPAQPVTFSGSTPSDGAPASASASTAALALARVDWRALEVQAGRVRLRKPGMAVTLNGLAQGYGADVALATLRAHGIEHALLDTGEFASLGRRDDGQPWTLAVRDPRDPDSVAHLLSTDGRCLATSGDYETTFSADFSSHHIVDPRTGASPPELASVSVLAPTGMLADALSTACMVLGMEKSLQLAERLPDADLLCIAKSGEKQCSAGFPDASRRA